MVPNRTRETLVDIIDKYVKKDSVIFSDGWKSYAELPGLQHYVVIHGERFVKYCFLDNRFVVKVTTNNTERERVELRKYVRGLSVDRVADRLFEVTYRLYRLSCGNINGNFTNMDNYISSYCKRQTDPYQQPSAFVPSRAGQVVQGPLWS